MEAKSLTGDAEVLGGLRDLLLGSHAGHAFQFESLDPRAATDYTIQPRAPKAAPESAMAIIRDHFPSLGSASFLRASGSDPPAPPSSVTCGGALSEGRVEHGPSRPPHQAHRIVARQPGDVGQPRPRLDPSRASDRREEAPRRPCGGA